MKKELEFKLTKRAKNQGGDRYEHEGSGNKMVIYIPQQFSRAKGAPFSTLKLTIEA